MHKPEIYQELLELIEKAQILDTIIATEFNSMTPSDALIYWEALSRVNTIFKKTESYYRKAVADSYFPTKREGTNSVNLVNGYKLKLGYPIERKLDEAAFDSEKEALKNIGVRMDLLISSKPILSTKYYKTLEPQLQRQVDNILIIKPGSITLSLEPPKQKE